VFGRISNKIIDKIYQTRTKKFKIYERSQLKVETQ